MLPYGTARLLKLREECDYIWLEVLLGIHSFSISCHTYIGYDDEHISLSHTHNPILSTFLTSLLHNDVTTSTKPSRSETSIPVLTHVCRVDDRFLLLMFHYRFFTYIIIFRVTKGILYIRYSKT